MIYIKSYRKHKRVKVRGTRKEIMTELSCFMEYLMDKGALTKKDIEECLKVACMTEEELDKAIKEKAEEFKKTMQEICEKVDFSKMAFDLTNVGGKDDKRGKKEIKEVKRKGRPAKKREGATKQDN